MKVLVIAAHPDDEVLGCGGVIAKHAERGDRVSVCILCAKPQPGADGEFEKEMKGYTEESNRILGVKKTFSCDFRPMELNVQPMLSVVRFIESCVSEVRPEIVYTHHRGDVHTDHKVVFDATVAATRSFGNYTVKKILCFEVPSSTQWAPPFIGYTFVPNVFVDITKSLGKKIEAMKAYKSEMRKYPHPRSPEAIELKSKVWGIKVGSENVEAFELVREII